MKGSEKLRLDLTKLRATMYWWAVRLRPIGVGPDALPTVLFSGVGSREVLLFVAEPQLLKDVLRVLN